MISGKAFGVALNMFGLFNLETNFHDNMVNHVLCVYILYVYVYTPQFVGLILDFAEC